MSINAKELMIGDWVYLYAPDEDGKEKCYIGKVCAFSNHGGLGLDGDCDVEYNVEHCDEEYFERTEPIPLTAEILEKNGFERRGEWAMYFTTEDYDIIWRTDTNPTPHLTIESMTKRIGNFRSYNCNNVHELQRTLRCCGLWDLAENFKI